MAPYRGLSKPRDSSSVEVMLLDFSENARGWVAGPPPDYAVVLPVWLRTHTVAGEARPPAGARTPLGSRLRSLRAAIIASGEPLLDLDGVRREVAERRGERE